MQNIVVTGCAGFIGSHLCEELLKLKYHIIGIDNFDPFYPKEIKESNLHQLLGNSNFTFIEADLADIQNCINHINQAEVVIHLAGKAGVRPSIEHPDLYIDNNITATKNVLEAMRKNSISKMLFASSSSVYGNNPKTPWSESLNVDNPISPYAFSKKSCELLNHTYHHLYNLDILNLRFFTVFGPRQRPDLAIHKFVKLIENNQEITMYGDGNTSRDYTYVKDTCSGIIKALEYITDNENVFDTLNLGHHHPVKLKDLINMIGDATGITPKIKRLPMQPGDVDITYADISKAQNLFGYCPKTEMKDGLSEFVKWYRQTHVTQNI
ncbi:MAG: GDP-mannose 4,6-dehydratase [Marinilabiliaceae bacterium]|nr:GDP-mannose 4,6-dehydratase [Marinilabiliaceae bacterium]